MIVNLKIIFIITVLFGIVSCVNETSNNEENFIEIKKDSTKNEPESKNIENDSIGFGELWVYQDSAIIISDTVQNYDIIDFLRHNTKINFTYDKTKYISEFFPRGYIEESTFHSEKWYKILIDTSNYWIKEKDIRYESIDSPNGPSTLFDNNNYVLEMKYICGEGECYKKDGIVYSKQNEVCIINLEIKYLHKAQWINQDSLIYSETNGTYLYSVSNNKKEKISSLEYYTLDININNIFIIGTRYSTTDSNMTCFIKYNLKDSKKDSIILTRNYGITNFDESYHNPDFSYNDSDSTFMFKAYFKDYKKNRYNSFWPLTKIFFNLNGEIISTEEIK